MRHRHRLSRVRRRRLASTAHDPGLRPQRSVQACSYPRLRPHWTGARLRRRGADRAAWADLDRPAGQSRVFRLRHQQGRRAADRRPRKASERSEGTDGGEPALSGCWSARYAALQRRAHGFPDAENADRGIRQGQRRQGRDFVMIVDEQILNECQEARQLVFFVDVTIESRPMVVSNFSVPEASGNFCQRGGRFGSHSSNESMAPVFYKKIAFIAYFNAGVRAVDVRNPYQPKEIGYFIPPITEATDKRCIKVDGVDRCKTAIQSNNVESDDRGYIYVVDRANTGMHILELTGEARAIAGLQ